MGKLIFKPEDGTIIYTGGGVYIGIGTADVSGRKQDFMVDFDSWSTRIFNCGVDVCDAMETDDLFEVAWQEKNLWFDMVDKSEENNYFIEEFLQMIIDQNTFTSSWAKELLSRLERTKNAKAGLPEEVKETFRTMSDCFGYETRKYFDRDSSDCVIDSEKIRCFLGDVQDVLFALSNNEPINDIEFMIGDNAIHLLNK